MNLSATPHQWHFFRAGGFDQVRLDSGADLLAIGELDQKLWVALSCPTRGIEFDAGTLALLDSDVDGQIRAAELIAAARWAGSRLNDAEVLAAGLSGVPLAAIRNDDDEGRLLAEAAAALAAELGKGKGDLLTVDEIHSSQVRRQARLDAVWEARRDEALVLGEATAAAYAAVVAVQEKIEDYFTRCRLAAFDPRAAAALNADETVLKSLAANTLSGESASIAALPLSRVEAGRALPLTEGVNPAWAARIAALHELVLQPLLGERAAMTVEDWNAVQTKLAPFVSWLAARPAGGDEQTADGRAVRELERLARYVRDLLSLANNFVAFRDFYARPDGARPRASFQVGTLFLDGRSAELCVAVSDAGKHAALAGLSRIYLVYCDCRRGADRLSIAAAFTAGDSDQLMAGRNGVFYDRQGHDWDATVTRIVEHPISLRQAFWSPYRRLGRLVGEQLQKIAGTRAKAVDDSLAGGAAELGKKSAAAAKAPAPAAAATAFDVGKFAGIFAAIGLAIGAIGTALAAMLTGVVALKWWQMPLALAGLLLAISGPAVAMAWFKLRSRNLGPILDANGWAINARARINIPFGTSLTELAVLPEGAERSLTDPYAEKPTPWGFYLGVVIVAAIIGYYLVRRGLE